MDAIQLLKADHRQVEEWFEEFEKSRSDDKKEKLAHRICTALTVHTQIEEEIFYPAYLEATGDDEMHDEAQVEHKGARNLIAEIEAGKPGENMWEAKVSVLSEMIKHHVHEEEMRDGMFARARKSDMDLDDIGMKLARRKRELMRSAGKL
jgi:hemerythrin superfamily protein